MEKFPQCTILPHGAPCFSAPPKQGGRGKLVKPFATIVNKIAECFFCRRKFPTIEKIVAS